MAGESESGTVDDTRTRWRTGFSNFLDNLSFKQQEFIEGWLFVSGKMALILFVIGFPMVFGIYVSFTQSNLLNLPGEFVGLDNYMWLIEYPVWWTSVKNVLLLGLVIIPTNIIFSFSTALLLREKLRGSTFYRVVFLVPVAGPPVIWAIVWKLVLFPTKGGILNALLIDLGVIETAIPFLSSAQLALPSVIVSQIWGFGLSMLIYMAALAGLPETVMESASMDGADKYQKIRYIIWPLIRMARFIT